MRFEAWGATYLAAWGGNQFSESYALLWKLCRRLPGKLSGATTGPMILRAARILAQTPRS